MSFILHELMELGLLISAIAVTWAVPRPDWVSKLYTRIARFFGSQKTFN
jgi:cytochrome c oxidase assembly factor CtaG